MYQATVKPELGPIETVVFDFFDVIHGDPQKRFLKEVGQDRAGFYATASDALDAGQINIEDYFAIYAAASGWPQPDVEAFFDQSGVDEDVVNIIHELGATGLTVGLISNGSSDEVRGRLREHGLEGLFDSIIISAEVGIRKPDERIYTAALEMLGGVPKKTLFVDDNPENVSAAVAQGWHGHVHVGSIALRERLHQLEIFQS